jgi:hypothetical protein
MSKLSAGPQAKLALNNHNLITIRLAANLAAAAFLLKLMSCRSA